jgi:hypothetical protein
MLVTVCPRRRGGRTNEQIAEKLGFQEDMSDAGIRLCLEFGMRLITDTTTKRLAVSPQAGNAAS